MHVFYVITHHAPAEKGVNWAWMEKIRIFYIAM